MRKLKIAIIISCNLIFFSNCQYNNINIEEAEIANLYEQADSVYQEGDLVNSFRQFKDIISFVENANINYDTQTYYLNSILYLGDIYERLGKQEKALETYLQCKNLARQLNRKDILIYSITSISYLSTDSFDVRNLLKKAFKEFSGDKKYEAQLTTLSYRLALINAQAGKFGKARGTIEELLENPIFKNNNIAQFGFYKGLAKVDFLEKKYDNCISNCRKGIEIQHNYEMEKAEIYLLLSEAYFQKNNIDEIKNTLKKAEGHISGDLILQKKLNELYSKLYEKTKNTQKSINILNNLREIDNTLNDKNNKIQGYISDKLEIDKLEANKAHNQARTKYISGIGILLLLSLSLFHLYKQTRNKKDKLELEISKEKLQVKNKQLEVENKQLELIAVNKVIDMQEEKDKMFAENLHDNVGANLSALNMFLSTLKKDIPDNKYQHLSKVLRETIKGTRNFAHLLEPPALKGAGLIGAITEKAEEFSCDKLTIEVNSPVEYVGLEDTIARSLYNAILEFMSNTMRYAKATKMQIDFTLPNQEILAVKVTDNGKGFDTTNIPQSKGLGLNSIKSRVNYFKGSFDIQSSNKGTIINITVPAKETLKQSA